MMGRGLVVLILLYVVLDFANPLVPGAVSFDADDSVDGVHAERRTAPQPIAVAASDPTRDVTEEEPTPEPAPAAYDRRAAPVRRLFALRRVPRPPDSPAGTDDH